MGSIINELVAIALGGIFVASAAGLLAILLPNIFFHLPRRLLHWRRQRDLCADEPRCPQCRYIVKGVASSTCPECGADLTAGVLVPHPLPPLSPRARAMETAAVRVCALSIAGFWVIGHLWPPCNQVYWYIIAATPAAKEKYAQIQVVGCGRGNSLHLRTDTIDLIDNLRAHTPLMRPTIRIDSSCIVVGTAHADGVRGMPVRTLTIEELQAFVAMVCHGESPQAQRAIAEDLMALVHHAGAGGAPERFRPSLLYIESATTRSKFIPTADFIVIYAVCAFVLTTWRLRRVWRQALAQQA